VGLRRSDESAVVAASGALGPACDGRGLASECDPGLVHQTLVEIGLPERSPEAPVSLFCGLGYHLEEEVEGLVGEPSEEDALGFWDLVPAVVSGKSRIAQVVSVDQKIPNPRQDLGWRTVLPVREQQAFSQRVAEPGEPGTRAAIDDE